MSNLSVADSRVNAIHEARQTNIAPHDVLAPSDELWGDYLRSVELAEFRHRQYGEPLLPLVELVEVQASYYRSWGSDVGDLIAGRLAGLADELRLYDARTPEQYHDRRETMLEGVYTKGVA